MSGLALPTHSSDVSDMALRFTLRQLEYFVAVGEVGSITIASERVNVSPPSISAAIAQLEGEFGIQLFVRHHAQGLSLTPGGRRFLVQAKAVLAHAEALHELAGDVAACPRGPISIGCLVTLAPLILPTLRKRFEAAYAEARVSQVVAHQAGLLERLRRAEIDVALTYDLEIPQDVDFERLVSLPPYAVIAADHPLAERAALTLEELSKEPMVLLDLPMSRDYFISLFQSKGLSPLIAERASDMSIMYSLAANGFGYALANIRPRTDIAPDGGKLRFIPVDSDFRPMTLGVATMRSERKSRILAAFQDHCRRSINEQEIPGMAAPIFLT